MHTPNLETQRVAMRKLDFLIGRWTGEARMTRGPCQYIDLIQTEEAQYKLDGLALTVEGIGKSKGDGTRILQALGLITYDDEYSTYRMRAFNDGRDLKLLEDGPASRGASPSARSKQARSCASTDAAAGPNKAS